VELDPTIFAVTSGTQCQGMTSSSGIVVSWLSLKLLTTG